MDYQIITDASENLYVVGRFEGTVDFDPGAGTDSHTSAGETDGYISKFNSSGTHQWTRTFGSTLSDQASGVALDGSGNLYITGYFRGALLILIQLQAPIITPLRETLTCLLRSTIPTVTMIIR